MEAGRNKMKLIFFRILLTSLAVLVLAITSCKNTGEQPEASADGSPRWTQVLFFNPDDKNQKIFHDFEKLLGENDIPLRPGVISLGMVSYEIESEKLESLIEILVNDSTSRKLFANLFDKEFIADIVSREEKLRSE